MRRSLVLITVDCLRADHVGFLGYNRATTPFLDSLAAQSFTFSNAIAAGTPTYYSFPAILASRYPLALGRDLVGVAPGEDTLARALRNCGYNTAAFVAGNPYLSSRFGYQQGFEVFEDFLNRDTDFDEESASVTQLGRINRRLARACKRFAPARRLYEDLYFQYCQRIASPVPDSLDALRRFPSADVLVDRALVWLKAQKQPFFLWLHLMDPHSPYYPKKEALEMLGERVPTPAQARYVNAYWNRDVDRQRLTRYRDRVMRFYDAGIRWADAQIARLVQALKARDEWQNCALAVTADHGEEFLDHGGRHHSPSAREELIRVPLLLRIPGSQRNTKLTSPFSLLHLAPTVLEAIGAAIPYGFQGRSYWPHLTSDEPWHDPAIVECVAGCTNPFRSEDRMGCRIVAVREKRFKLVFDFAKGQEELFDLETDPAERNPVPHSGHDRERRRLMKRAQQHILESHQLRDSMHHLGARLRDIRLELASSAQ